ncbi:SDR family oxidoreductase [Vibrio aquaticus]|uniref:SDR family oxidoreductase n=1 Tax=Vibrio aquaticus TaxID=2496559 RepID=A0A432CWL5_9VIBR|nr:SDR family oxidoreductase [Vibrio aquaticus]RTZ14654.1 SDR family oxidoreductase [Vibrio aquaticus]
MNRNLFSLSGMTALVTGASGYLGQEMCIGLAEAGATVLVNSRSEAKAAELVERLISKGFVAEEAIFDVTDENAVAEFFSAYQSDINIIVNNAYSGSAGTIESSHGSSYLDAYIIAVKSVHHIVNSALPHLRSSVGKMGYASVINIGSMYGVVSPDPNLYESAETTNPPFYGAAKAALIQLTKYSACEFGRENIRFNSISPGPFPNLATNNDHFVNNLSSKVPMGRVGKAEEIKGPLVFLSSEASSFVNGANLIVDGGWTIW